MSDTSPKTIMLGNDEIAILEAIAKRDYGSQRYIGRALRKTLRRALGLSRQLTLPMATVQAPPIGAVARTTAMECCEAPMVAPGYDALTDPGDDRWRDGAPTR